MKAILLTLILASGLLSQDGASESPRGLITATLVAAVDPLGTRQAQTNLTLIYFDNTADDQFADLNAIRTDVSQFIRNIPAAAAPEAFAKAIGKSLTEKYPQIIGLTVTLLLSPNAQGQAQFVVALNRVAPTVTVPVRTAVLQKLAEAASRPLTQSGLR